MASLTNKLINGAIKSNWVKSLSTMSAWQIDGFSADLESVLRLDCNKPLPPIRSPNELLIQVKASSVNPLDVMMCQGYGNELLEKLELTTQIKAPQVTYDRFPLTLGRDISGIVVDKGSQVRGFNVGDQVWGAIPPYKQGSHAQYAIVTDSEVTLKPRNLEHHEAAALPYASLTALAGLTSFGGLSESNCAGKRILVLGGSGGVGTIAIQLLKTWGAYVATTCSSDALSWVQEITDVDQAIDYRSGGLSGYTESFDMVFDCAKRSDGSTIDPIAFKCLKKQLTSTYVTITSPFLRNIDEKGLIQGFVWNAIKAGQDTLTGLMEKRSIRWAFFHPNPSGLMLVKKLTEEEKIKPIIDKIFNIDQLPQAYIKVQEGHLRGKTVIQIQ